MWARTALDLARDTMGVGATWLLQSTLLIAAGMLCGYLLRRHGAAAQSAVYRTTLLAALACPLLSWCISLAGYSGWSIEIPTGSPPMAADRISDPVTIASAASNAEATIATRPADAMPAALTDELAELPDRLPTAAAAARELPISVRSRAGVGAPSNQNESPATWQMLDLIAILLSLLWISVAAWLLAKLAAAWWRLGRIRGGAVAVDSTTIGLCQAQARMLGVTPPEVRRTPFLSSPCLAGIWKPVVLLPEEGAPLPLHDVFVHELAHLLRKDCHWNLVSNFATAVFWFHPLVWSLARRLEMAAEEVCDDIVVNLGGDRDGYAKRLVDFAEFSSARVTMAGVGIVSLRSTLAHRVSRIMDTSRCLSTTVSHPLLACTLVGGLVVTGIVGFVGAAPQAIAAPQETAAIAEPEHAAAAEPAQPAAAEPVQVALAPEQTAEAPATTESDGAVAKIEALGGTVTRDASQPGNPVIAINLSGTNVKDDDLQLLGCFVSLQKLSLIGTNVTDAGLKSLLGLKNLEELRLSGCKITNTGLLTDLTRLKHLKMIGLVGTQVTDAGIKEFSEALPNVRYNFDAAGASGVAAASKAAAPGSDEAIAKIEALGGTVRRDRSQPGNPVVEIMLSATNVKDDDLQLIGGFTNLRELYLIGTSITDAGLKYLVGLQNLEELRVGNTGITDAGLKELAKLKNLKMVGLIGTQVTEAGVKEFSAALPNMRHNLGAGGGQGGGGGGGQHSDPDFDTSVAQPAYTDTHPTVLFDEAHRNFHTAGGRYKPFADLITHDGYQVTPGTDKFTPEYLAKYQILISSNAMAGGRGNSAFTPEECDTVEKWVKGGGSLLLVTDFGPWSWPSQELGKRFGVDMSLRVTGDPANYSRDGLLFSRDKNQIGDHPIMNGRNDSERVNRVLTWAGQSLQGPSDSTPLLKFSDTAIEQDEGGGTVSAAGRNQGLALVYGQGRLVVMGEAGELSAQMVGNDDRFGMNAPGCDNRQMALNMMHWLSRLTN